MQTLTLETIEVHDRHSHSVTKMNASKSAPGVGGYSSSDSKGSAKDESGWWLSNYFSFCALSVSLFWHQAVQAMSAAIVVVYLQMWRLSSFGQQNQAASYWKSCCAVETRSAITNVSCAAS